MDNSTIIIYKKSGLYRFKLRAKNGEIVGTSSKGWKTYGEVLDVLYKSDSAEWETFDLRKASLDNRQLWFFKALIKFKSIHPMITAITTVSQIIRSEPYASAQKARQGRLAAIKALRIGLVSLEFSESTDIYQLSDLIADPSLGIVQT